MRPEERHAINDIRECENENPKSHFSNCEDLFSMQLKKLRFIYYNKKTSLS